MHNKSLSRGASPHRHNLASPLGPALLLLATGCVVNDNGSTFSGNNVGRAITFEGYASAPNEQVRVQVLDPADQVINAGSTWVTIATVNAAANPTDINGTNMYYYNTSATPVPNNAQADRWRAGGLARFRVMRGAGAGVPLVTFDDFDCAVDAVAGGATPLEIEAQCKSYASPVLTFVDRDPLPGKGIDYLSLRSTEGQGDEYSAYLETLAGGDPDTLEEYRASRGFPAGEVVARYYNKGDLGLGREMHCRSNNDIFIPNTPLVSCYVTNYGDPTDGLDDQASALQNAIDGHAPFATVAMDYWSGSAEPVRFYVYGSDGNQVFDAELDGEGLKSVPGVCLACHGGTFNNMSKSVSGARFLPFDLEAFGYANSGAYTRANQEEELRKLNHMVYTTNPGASITNIISGWYGGYAGLIAPGTTQDSSYVPAGWDGKEVVYRQAVAPYCRTCHIALSTKIDTFAQLQALGTAQSLVCDSHIMPHSQVTRGSFWKSAARAHLAGSLGWANDCD